MKRILSQQKDMKYISEAEQYGRMCPDSLKSNTEATTILTVMQTGQDGRQKTLLRVLMNTDGEFDIVQFARADPLRNLVICIREGDQTGFSHTVFEDQCNLLSALEL